MNRPAALRLRTIANVQSNTVERQELSAATSAT